MEVKKVEVTEHELINLPNIPGEEFHITVHRYVLNKLLENGFDLNKEIICRGEFTGITTYIQKRE